MNQGQLLQRGVIACCLFVLPGLFGPGALASLNPQTPLAPGQTPPGPPPPPGQLGPAPQALPKDGTQATKITEPKRNQTIGDVIGNADQQVDIRTTTRNILVPTTVLDPDGHGYVNGILPKEFELFDNDRPQSISAEFVQIPISVVLAVQANADVEPVIDKLRKSGVLLHGLVTGDGGDLAVLAFDHRLQVLQDFTSDPDKIDDAMHKLTAGSSSANLIDAVVEGERMLSRHDPANARRHVILLVSRNVDKGSANHIEETGRRLQFRNVIVYSIDISKAYTEFYKKMPLPRPPNGGIPASATGSIAGGSGPVNDTTLVQQQTGNLANAAPLIYHSIRDFFKKTPTEAFTQLTGGQSYSFATQRAMELAITDIGKDLNSQYLLSYSPAEATREEPGYHHIRVAVNRPGLTIRNRPGYWWGGGKQ